MITLLTILFFISAPLLIIVVILQSQRQGSLESLAGGNNPLGVQSSKALNKLTVFIGIFFILVVFFLSLSYNRDIIRKEKQAEQAKEKVLQGDDAVEEDASSKEEQSKEDDSTDSSNND